MARSKKNIIFTVVRNGCLVGDVLLARYFERPPRFLPVIVLFVTGQCNLRCRMCGVCDLEFGHEPNQELTTEQWKEVIYCAAKKLGTSLAAISGGEPLLREDLYELIRFATDCGISIHLCTNAVLLNRDNILRLKDSGVHTVAISLESPNASTHDYLRGDNTFPIVTEAIRELRSLAPEVRIGINYLITRRNYKNMRNMVAFAESLGVQQIKFAPIHTNLLHRNKIRETYDDLLFETEDLDDLRHELRLLKEACKQSHLITTTDAFFNGIDRLYSNPLSFRCFAGYAICAISPTGNVAPCCDKDSYFNVKENSLDCIWRDPEFHKLRKQVHTCTSKCWDTTYTELSLILRPSHLLLNFIRNLRDIKFYFGHNLKSNK